MIYCKKKFNMTLGSGNIFQLKPGKPCQLSKGAQVCISKCTFQEYLGVYCNIRLLALRVYLESESDQCICQVCPIHWSFTKRNFPTCVLLASCQTNSCYSDFHHLVITIQELVLKYFFQNTLPTNSLLIISYIMFFFKYTF